MKKYYFLIFIIALIVSCKSENFYNSDLSRQINKRIEILENSYKFTVIPENLQDKYFDKLKTQIDLVLSDSKIDLQENYKIVNEIFDKYDIPFADRSESITDLKFDIIIGLDDLIFKYLPSRLNFSDYNVIVVPNKTEIVSGDTLRAKIHLTVSDSLYEPEVKYLDLDSEGNLRNVYNLPCENGIGEYNMVTRKKGIKKLNGFVIYSNEFGYKDTIDWNYEFEVK
jgi:hypothetical protein